MKKAQNSSDNRSANGVAIMGGGYASPLIEMPNAPDVVFYLYGPIVDELDYVDIVHAIAYAQEGQRITLRINSPGGNLNVCLAIINAINNSQGDVVTVIDGEAASAAAMIWLAGHVKMIASKHTILMLHTASVGFGSTKLPEIKANVDVSTKIMVSLIKELAHNVLVESEIVDLHKGVDVWLTGDEIIKRLPMDENEDEGSVET